MPPREPAATRARPVAWSAIGALLPVLTAVACARAPERVSVPTFPAAVSPAASTRSQDAGPRGLSCEGLLPATEAVAVLGMPLGSLALRTVDGTPARRVGRLTKLACSYSTDGPAPRDVLRVVVAGFVDASSARAQNDRNTTDTAGAEPPRPLPMGGAHAVLVPGGDRSELLTSYGRFTVDLTLTGVGTPGPPGSVLGDLARRVLARMPGGGAPHATGVRHDGPLRLSARTTTG